MGTAIVWRATCEPMGGVIGAPTDAVSHRSVWPEWYIQYERVVCGRYLLLHVWLHRGERV